MTCATLPAAAPSSALCCALRAPLHSLASGTVAVLARGPQVPQPTSGYGGCGDALAMNVAGVAEHPYMSAQPESFQARWGSRRATLSRGRSRCGNENAILVLLSSGRCALAPL